MFWDEFEIRTINSFNKYMLPVIVMKKENPKEAVCQVFEKVNTGGVPLDIFELLTATFAADDFELKKDWQKIKKEFKNYKQLARISNTDIIQAVTLLTTYNNRMQAAKQGVAAEELPAVRCKRCVKNNIKKDDYNCIINKTPLSSRTNRIVGGQALSKYLRRLQKHTGVSDKEFNKILESHILIPGFLCTDDFEGFFNDRKEKLLQRIERAMNKSIPRDAVPAEDGTYIDEDDEE